MKRPVASLVILFSLAAIAFAQTDAKATAQSDAEKSFALLKTIAGAWQGPVTGFPKQNGMIKDGQPVQVKLQVTSRGNAIVHEMQDPKSDGDPAKYDHPITMLYLDSNRLLLTHYCDAGNRPRMAARSSADGKTVEFDFLDVAGPTDVGHMNHAVFTIIDADHHTEDWTYLLPDGKQLRAHMDLSREKNQSVALLQ